MGKTYNVGAELLLRDRMSGPLGAAGGALERLSALGGDAGQQFKGMAKDLAKAGAAALVAKKAFGGYARGVREAAGLKSADVDLKIAVSRTGDDPAAIERTMKRLRATAFDVSKDVTGTQGDVEQMFAAGLKMGFSEDVLLGGLGRAGALLAEATGQDKATALRQAGKFGTPFGAKGGEMERFANLLVQGADTGKFESAAQFSHEMSRAGPAIAALGGSAEDAATLLAMMSEIRTEQIGTSVAAAMRELTAGGKQSKLRKYGLDQIIDKQSGSIRSLPDVQRVLQQALGGRKGADQLRILNEVFGSEGSLFAQALLGGADAAKVQADMLGRLAVEERNRLKSGTFEKAWDAMTGTFTTGMQNAFLPAEGWATSAVNKLNELLVSPAAAKIQGSEGAQTGMSAAPLIVGSAAIIAAAVFGSRGIAKGVKGWKAAGGMKGLLGSDAAALVKAKSLEKIAGVQPVSVVNVSDFQGMFGGGGAAGTAGRDAVQSASLMARLTKNRSLPGTLGKGAALTGGAAVAATAAVVAAGGAAIYGVDKTAKEAQAARAVADAQLARRKGHGSLVETVTETKRQAAERLGWNDERMQAEIRSTIAGYQAQGKVAQGYDGLGSNWWEGAKKSWTAVFGGDDGVAAKQQAAADKMDAAAAKMPDTIDVKVTIDQEGTRSTAKLHRRGQ
ncbi:MAG: phage tail tape measure protein [Candidatus Lernaella stagnicola]|nr:phage tail tape measure protein [Candidatus Lernaella stagnicola]